MDGGEAAIQHNDTKAWEKCAIMGHLLRLLDSYKPVAKGKLQLFSRGLDEKDLGSLFILFCFDVLIAILIVF